MFYDIVNVYLSIDIMSQSFFLIGKLVKSKVN